MPKEKKSQKIKRKATKPKKNIKAKKVVSKKKPVKILRGRKKTAKKPKKSLGVVNRSIENPIINPSSYPWESAAVFNPAALVEGGRVHLFYRALGHDGVSRIGYISSKDGIHFDERLSYPVFVAENVVEAQKHYPFTSPARLVYDPVLYASGGGWGGCEDPRIVNIEGRIYLTFNMFNGWDSMRVAYTSISEEDLKNKRWNWSKFAYLSRPGDRQKNWVLFPEKINGKFALFHNLDKGDSSRVHIAYLNNLDMNETPSMRDAPDPHTLPDHIVAWHNRTRSIAAPPIKTPDGWLIFYHAMDKNDLNRYKLGAMLLDLKDPEKVLYRASRPVLEPDMWYENDWKPGIIYVSGAVVKDGTLFLYYGGGDKHIAVASVNLKEFLSKLKTNNQAVFSAKSSLTF